MRSNRRNEARKRFEEITQEFREAHSEGMQSLSDGDFDAFAVAIESERRAIEKVSDVVKSGSALERPLEPLVSISAEHARLQSQMEALEREHRALEADPQDLEGHRQHRKKLEQQISELRSHIERLRDASETSPRP